MIQYQNHLDVFLNSRAIMTTNIILGYNSVVYLHNDINLFQAKDNLLLQNRLETTTESKHWLVIIAINANGARFGFDVWGL